MKPGDLWPNEDDAGLVELSAGTDVWALHRNGFWVLVPTNTCRKKDGSAVMGAGLAGAAALRFPGLASRYGSALKTGSEYMVAHEHRLLLGPTKEDWRQTAKIELVHLLLARVANVCETSPDVAVAVPAPGCGLGGLLYEDVRRAAFSHLAHCRAALLPPLRTRTSARS